LEQALEQKLARSIEQAAAEIAKARQIAVLTGAGVSKESGIPTFRDAMTGLWAQYEPEKLATPEGFKKDPPLVWQWYDYRRGMVAKVEPNAGHYAIARLAEIKPVVVVTQNVDGLHARAGSKDVIELHGNISTFFCFDEHHPANDVPLGLKEPPLCHCGSPLRPGVVWFGEMLPEDALERATALMRQSDVVMVVGTSGIVQPAASLPLVARRAGAKIIEINPEPTPIGDLADIFLCGPSGKVLPMVLDRLQQES
jgi:NAD-dependent deacetylase